MIDEVIEKLGQKSVDQYKIIEDRYLTLKKYLRLYLQNHTLITKEDLELILGALDKEAIEKEEGTNYE